MRKTKRLRRRLLRPTNTCKDKIKFCSKHEKKFQLAEGKLVSYLQTLPRRWTRGYQEQIQLAVHESSGLHVQRLQHSAITAPVTSLLNLPDSFGDAEGLAVYWWLLFLSFFTAAEAALVGRLEAMWLILRPKVLLDLEGTLADVDFFSSSHAAKMFMATWPLTHRSRCPASTTQLLLFFLPATTLKHIINEKLYNIKNLYTL